MVAQLNLLHSAVLFFCVTVVNQSQITNIIFNCARPISPQCPRGIYRFSIQVSLWTLELHSCYPGKAHSHVAYFLAHRSSTNQIRIRNWGEHSSPYNLSFSLSLVFTYHLYCTTEKCQTVGHLHLPLLRSVSHCPSGIGKSKSIAHYNQTTRRRSSRRKYGVHMTQFGADREFPGALPSGLTIFVGPFCCWLAAHLDRYLIIISDTYRSEVPSFVAL